MAFLSIGDLLPGRIKQSGLLRDIQAAIVLQKANSLLEEMFGEGVLQTGIKAVGVKFKILHVAVIGQPYYQELRMREQDYLSLLRQRLGNNMVEKIKIIL